MITKTRPLTTRKRAPQRPKPTKLTRKKARHCQRNVGKRTAYPKRPTKTTRPFETTLDF